jgi:hypothetical protein
MASRGQITQRRLLAARGKTLSDTGAPPALIAKLLRHKDAATSITPLYTQSEINQVRGYLVNMDEHITPSTADAGEMPAWIAELAERRHERIRRLGC